MNKWKMIALFAAHIAEGLVPLPLQPIAHLVEQGVDQIFAQVDAENQRHGLMWQEIETQLTAEQTDETKAWDKFVARLEAGE